MAEAFGLLFAQELDLHVPEAAIQIHGGEHAWLSRRVPAITHWDEAKIPFIENLHDLGGILALDALLLNEDRHRQNILLQSVDGTQDTFEVWGIDMGDALVGFPTDFLDMGLEIPDPKNLAPGIPVRNLRQSAVEIARRAASIEESLIEEFCHEACQLVQETTMNRYSAVLKRRCEHAEDIVSRYLATIEASS